MYFDNENEGCKYNNGDNMADTTLTRSHSETFSSSLILIFFDALRVVSHNTASFFTALIKFSTVNARFSATSYYVIFT